MSDKYPRGVLYFGLRPDRHPRNENEGAGIRMRVGEQPDANQIRLLLGWPRERHEFWGVPGWSK